MSNHLNIQSYSAEVSESKAWLKTPVWTERVSIHLYGLNQAYPAIFEKDGSYFVGLIVRKRQIHLVAMGKSFTKIADAHTNAPAMCQAIRLATFPTNESETDS